MRHLLVKLSVVDSDKTMALCILRTPIIMFGRARVLFGV